MDKRYTSAVEQSVRCATCGTERPAGRPCPKCLLGLGLDGPGADYEQIGPYKILSRLGRGGMGEVYRALDERLHREVAIKVLPARVANDPERIARFRREARVAASLNHPNIAAIYGFEEIDDAHFLVMELVLGRSLAERLQAGPMPIDEALSVIAQIAEGLEAAHEAGVVHRDLKPSNVMLTADGKVKILDFGLAKAMDTEAPVPELDRSPTISAHYTTPGTVIGTVPYMSPEQARGRAVDKRTDIWSLGCVLYECLTGKRAFEGDTATDVLAKVLEREPSWDAIPGRVPARVRELILRCLEKDPQRRLRDAGDLRIELERARDAREWSSSAVVRPAPSVPWRRSRSLPWSIAGLALVVAGVAVAIAIAHGGWSRSGQGARLRGASAIPLRVDVTDPDVPNHPAWDHSSVAVSPDGMTIAYFGKKTLPNGFEWSICLRRADEIHVARCIDAPDPAFAISDPFFSPDGKWLGFSSQGLYKVPLGGGNPTLVAEAVSAGGTKGAVWTERGIVFSPAAKAGLLLVGENGGATETLTVPDSSKGEVSHRWPATFPDGRHLLFTIKKEGITSFDQADIAVLDLDTRTWKTVLHGGTFARYLPTGHIVYARDGAIMAVRYDASSQEVRGAPVKVLADVMTEPGSGAAQFAVAPAAELLAFVPGGSNIDRRELVWLDRQGKVTPTGAPLEPYYEPFVSPDGTRIASTVFGATDTVVVYDLARGSSVRVKTVGNSNLRCWYPDGRELLVASDAEGGGTSHLYVTEADGSGTPRRLANDIAGDAQFVARTGDGPGIIHITERMLYLSRSDGGSERRPLTGFGEHPAVPRVSPDGRWLSYDREVSGHREVYVRPFPTGNDTWQISRGGGYDARWSPRGDELVYRRDAEGSSWLVSVTLSITANQLATGAPKDLVKVPAGLWLSGFASDGQRILALRVVPPQFAGDRVLEILNWFDQVREKMQPTE